MSTHRFTKWTSALCIAAGLAFSAVGCGEAPKEPAKPAANGTPDATPTPDAAETPTTPTPRPEGGSGTTGAPGASTDVPN